MWRMAIVLSMLAACGGDDAGSVSGTVHGTSIPVADSVSAAVTINSNQHGAAILLALLSFAGPAASPRSRRLVLLAALAIAISGCIGVYHAGVEAKIFEGFTQCTATARATNTADLLKQIVHAPLVRCDEVQFRFLGISMAGWNAILSLGGAAVILVLTLRGAKRG